jgi:8-oxo-dGTP pyrophosphatase MutT (NUDIX family)
VPDSPKKTLEQVVGVVLLRPDGAALLQHRDNLPAISDPGLWVFPGGHLEAGETPAEGAVREVEEETSYRCGELRELTRIQQDDVELVFFLGNYDGRQSIECNEGQELAFVTRARVESLPKPRYLAGLFDLALAKRDFSSAPCIK